MITFNVQQFRIVLLKNPFNDGAPGRRETQLNLERADQLRIVVDGVLRLELDEFDRSLARSIRRRLIATLFQERLDRERLAVPARVVQRRVLLLIRRRQIRAGFEQEIEDFFPGVSFAERDGVVNGRSRGRIARVDILADGDEVFHRLDVAVSRGVVQRLNLGRLHRRRRRQISDTHFVNKNEKSKFYILCFCLFFFKFPDNQ